MGLQNTVSSESGYLTEWKLGERLYNVCIKVVIRRENGHKVGNFTFQVGNKFLEMQYYINEL